MRFLAVLTVKNEAAFLLDWLAHHRAVGFTDFLVFSNDCSDGTDAMLDRLAQMGWLTHMRNPGPYGTRGVQFSALKAADTHPAVAAADWILPLDVDEFLCIKVGAHRLTDLLGALPEANAITLTWRLFGNNGQVQFTDAPVTEIFDHCAPEVIHWPWRAAMFKTLYRNNGTYRGLGVHRPRSPRKGQLHKYKWVDGAGRTLPEHFKTQRVFSDFGQSNTDLVQLNHYPLGAMESYVVKADRGRAVHSAERLGMDYWVERNFNDERDTSVRALSAPMHAIRDDLRSDPVLARLQAQAVTWRHERFRALMLDDTYRSLFARLLMTPASRSMTVQDARTMLGFAQAADSASR